MQIVRKITVKIVNGGNRPAPFAEEIKMDEKRPILTIVGRAAGVREASSQLPDGSTSEYLRFTGTFAAWKGEMGNGDEFRSGVAILPPVAADFLAGSLAGDEVSSVDFAFVIGVKKADTPTSYEYYCEPIVQEAEESNPLKAIMEKTAAAQKALTAPKGKAA